MDQLFPGVIASLIAAAIAALGAVMRRPALRGLRRIGEYPRLLALQRRRVAHLEETLRTARSLVLALDISGIDCSLTRVRRDVNTRLQWSKEEPKIVEIMAGSTKVLRIDRGAQDGVIEGMKVRIWSRCGGADEEYVFQSHDIDQRSAQIRPRHPGLLALSKFELGVSFVTPCLLTPLEDALSKLLNVIDSSVPDSPQGDAG